MRKIILTLTLVLLMAAFTSPPARADSIGDTVNDIRNKVNEIVSRVRYIYDRVRDVYNRTTGLPGIASTLAEVRTALDSGTPVRSLVELARDEVTELAQDEAQRLIAFVNSTEPENVRLMLEGFVRDLRDVTNAQLDVLSCLDLPCSSLEMPYVTFERLLEVIRNAPASALYPIYRAQNVLDRMGNLGDLLACLRDQMVEHKSLLCEVLDDLASPSAVVNDPEKMTALRNLRRALRAGAFLAKILGSGMQLVAKSFDIQFEAALWGWVGVSIDSDVVEALGKKVQGLNPTLNGLADRLWKRIQRLELAAYQEAVIANQQLILDQLQNPGRGTLRGILRRR